MAEVGQAEAGQAVSFYLHPESAQAFSPDNRFVTRLYKSAASEILIVCWEPGQKSSTHSHGESESIVMVLEGKMKVRTGEQERVLSKYEIVITPRGMTHQMTNDPSCRSVTLHIYAPSTKTPVSQPFRDLSPQI